MTRIPGSKEARKPAFAAQPTSSAWWFGLLSAASFTGGPLIAHTELVSPLAGFLLFALGGLLSLAGVLAGLWGLVLAKRQPRAHTGRGLAASATVLAAFGALASPGRQYPRINDITTDFENPPQFVHVANLPTNQGRDMSYPTAFAAQQRSAYPDLGPLRTTAPPAVVFEEAARAAASMPGWEVVHTDPLRRTVEGVSTTRVFRFRDDFVIEVRPMPDGSAVHMRSKSRDGKGDIGANARRIRTFFDALQSRLPSASRSRVSQNAA